jgi:hypothetical protein
VRCLADGGRLLEIGKYDILKDTPLGMRPLLRNVAFEGVDLDRIMNDPSHKDEVGFESSFPYHIKLACLQFCSLTLLLSLYIKHQASPS